MFSSTLSSFVASQAILLAALCIAALLLVGILQRRLSAQNLRLSTALNNMSHGLCMLDQQDHLQVWNERLIELLHLQNAPIRVGMRM